VAPKKVVALTSFVFEHDGGTTVVHAGDVFTPTHAVVKGRRELFESEVSPNAVTTEPGGKRSR
jgi:hypothetical protein